MIDGKIVNGCQDTHEIDENNLFATSLDSENTKDKIKLQFIALATESETNIKNFKSGYIWKTGDGVTLIK